MKTFTQIPAIWALLVCLADLCCTKEEQPEAMDRTGFAQVNIIKESVSTGTTRTKNIDKERRKQLREKRYRLSLDLVDSIPYNRNSL